MQCTSPKNSIFHLICFCPGEYPSKFYTEIEAPPRPEEFFSQFSVARELYCGIHIRKRSNKFILHKSSLQSSYIDNNPKVNSTIIKVGFYLKAVFPSRNLGLMRISHSRFKQSKNCSLSHESMFCGVL